MAFEIIPDNDGKGFTEVLSSGDYEYVNPVEKLKSKTLEFFVSHYRTRFALEKPPFPLAHLDEFLLKNAENIWEREYADIISTAYPKKFDLLLQSNKKQEQVRFLKKQKISKRGLTAFIFNACEKHGYKYSMYRGEHHHKGLDEAALPKLIHLKDNGEVFYSGNTTLSDGQLKQVIKHRTVIWSKFIDNKEENKWHCFFFTNRSLGGEENWENGTPHIHYISNTFGLTREQVLKELKSKEYKLNNLPHIELYTE